jgi:hypothetical protein
MKLGRLIPEKQIVQNNINNYIKQTNIDYSKFIEGVPTFVTYYKKDSLNSTHDESLDAVVDVVGKDSPVDFKKIEDFPIYGIEAISIAIQRGEFGVESEYDSSATILPNTIKPLPEDYFIINYLNTDFLFKITNVDVDKIKNIKFYKITFSLSADEVEQIDQQVSDEFQLIYENIGTDNKTILAKSDAILNDYLIKVYDKFIDIYTRMFLDKRFNIIAFKINDTNIYNDYLVKFIMDNQLFKRNRIGIYNSFYIDDVFETSDVNYFDEFYERAYFYALENRDTSQLQIENFRLSLLDDERFPFYQHYEKYYKSVYDDSFVNNEEAITPHQNVFIYNIKNNILYPDNIEYYLENLIIKFFNEELTLNEELLDSLIEYDLKPCLSHFLLLPCILFILKYFKEKLVM